MTLHYLLFEASAGADDSGLFEAMAAVPREQAPAVEAEIATVLDWADMTFAQRAPLEDGGDWDVDLSRTEETDGAGRPLVVFSLSIAGTAAFCEAFSEQFGDALA